MKHIIQDLNNGKTLLEDVPIPKPSRGQVLIKSICSLVSLGTERMLVEFGKANYLEKARQQPDKVKMVFDKIRTDGLQPTIQSVKNKLNQPIPLGYCNVGRVIELGPGIKGLKIGDRVASNGNHAEYVVVPENLTAKIPEKVSDEEAAFTVIGSIALQGIRLANPTFGETVVVFGLGLIGLIAAELLIANGCKVIGIDLDNSKLELARSKGVKTINPADGTDPIIFINEYTFGSGADAVIITASSSSHDIIHQAAEMSRVRGRIVLVGVVGLNLRREDFYKKEITFQVSCSFGPGRYNDDYEQKGLDFPLGFVRWTENRNFMAILEAIESGHLHVQDFITERFNLIDFQQIYGNMEKSGSITSLINYNNEDSGSEVKISVETVDFSESKGVIGIIGAGNFTSATLLPALTKTKVKLKFIASLDGLSAKVLAKQYKVAFATSDHKQILNDKDVDLVIITTRHNAHASLVKEALEAGKNVFVEKPLALNKNQIAEIVDAYQSNIQKNNPKTITVGFNRRFAPIALKMKSLLGPNNDPINIVATMNAGFIPPESWVHDLEVGGGRIVGEACHFIDLCSYLTGSRVKTVCMNALGIQPSENTDNASILLKYANGSNAVINYFSNGSKMYSKERLEVYSMERVLIMDNWRKLRAYGFKKIRIHSGKQDKGHTNQFRFLVDNLRKGGNALIAFDEILNTTNASFAAVESLKKGKWINVE